MPATNPSIPERENRDANRDPITGEPGAHPVGVGAGAAAGGAAGAVLGAPAGPIGAAVGAVIGAVVGGYAGKGVAEAIDPTAEAAYWREHHGAQPFAEGRGYDDFSHAYATGYSGYRAGQTFEQREHELQRDYERAIGMSDAPAAPAVAPPPPASTQAASTRPLHWQEARPAARAAYERVQSAAHRPKPGEAGEALPD